MDARPVEQRRRATPGQRGLRDRYRRVLPNARCRPVLRAPPEGRAGSGAAGRPGLRAGHVIARLLVSTTGTDADWIVKLIDVYPPDRSAPEAAAAGEVWSPPVTLAGYQQLVRGWPLRGKFRRSFETPEPFEPGRVEAIEFTTPDVNHVFRRGHRVMVQVQSSWFPLIDRNPQTFTDIPSAAADDFRAATQRVMRSTSQPSGIEVLVRPPK